MIDLHEKNRRNMPIDLKTVLSFVEDSLVRYKLRNNVDDEDMAETTEVMRCGTLLYPSTPRKVKLPTYVSFWRPPVVESLIFEPPSGSTTVHTYTQGKRTLSGRGTSGLKCCIMNMFTK
jgi:hypothetical protein